MISNVTQIPTKINCIIGQHYEKHVHAIYRKIFGSKTENFQWKKMIFFSFFFAQNIDCGYTLEPPRRGGSNEYPQSMFWSKNKKKNRYTPVYPSFTIWGIRGYILHGHVFLITCVIGQ